jgi:hypothetical protein
MGNAKVSALTESGYREISTVVGRVTTEILGN